MDDNTQLLMMEKTVELVRIGVSLTIALILISELAKADNPSLQQALSQTITSVISQQAQIPQYRQQYYPDDNRGY